MRTIVSEGFDDGPCTERVVFFLGEVDLLAGGSVLDEDVIRARERGALE